MAELGGGNKKKKEFKCFYFFVGSIRLLSAEKQTKRSNVHGLVIDREAGEIIRLVASVCVFVYHP